MTGPEDFDELYQEPEFLLHGIAIFVAVCKAAGRTAIHPVEEQHLDVVVEEGQKLYGYSDEERSTLREALGAVLEDVEFRIFAFGNIGKRELN